MSMGLHAAGRGNPLRGLGEERPPGAVVNWRVIQRVLTYTRPYAAKRNFVFAVTAIRAFQKPCDSP